MRVMLSKFSKINPKKTSHRGARACCGGAGSAFADMGDVYHTKSNKLSSSHHVQNHVMSNANNQGNSIVLFLLNYNLAYTFTLFSMK